MWQNLPSLLHQHWWQYYAEKRLKSAQNSSFLSQPTPNLNILVNRYSDNDPEYISLSKYYDIEEMYNVKIPNKNKSLSLFHINAWFLNKNFLWNKFCFYEILWHLLSCAKSNFDITGVTETKITKYLH